MEAHSLRRGLLLPVIVVPQEALDVLNCTVLIRFISVLSKDRPWSLKVWNVIEVFV
jgi:hypothetical protein